ncbi:sulfate ABC transporter ATP-binding protein [Bombilactobacillus bombi]|uniref:Sulfate ABC transporter ATP-binding protein n=1 Tax=Bombilactobacillus bombi TaxID=1303590 RepID=A0A3R6ZAK8_9LACO|nr:ABC transporter ATP-binding protein/permease [Bombilactobacillus bombi]RHW48498.1 sulfate ABC transporter ATP-binding protein [Bombilactobacillus bombi]
MLNLQHLKKYYQVGDTTTKALDDVSVNFRNQEFVAILGTSGSGKTTLLNIIGGLDRYDSGNLIINGKSTQNFQEQDWDAYRNNTVGFIFQNYNIISHLSILDNVTLGMTLSGVDNSTKKQRAKEALERVGLKKHIHKKPSQLSGGQLQRVAIARALANDPEILLADEPTGALDTTTSKEIMDLIKELAQERLVIMVTHNPELAQQYADRIINFADGKILSDSNPDNEPIPVENFHPRQTKMSFATALKLSFTNIATKKGRTFLTILASSIGIISIGIVLALSNGFQKQIDATQSEALAQFPITISQVTADQKELQKGDNSSNSKQKFIHSKAVFAQVNPVNAAQHINNITPQYINYLKKIKKTDAQNISFASTTSLNLLRKVNGQYQPVTFSTTANNSTDANNAQSMMTSNLGVGGSIYPAHNQGKQNFLKKNYRVLHGHYPKKATDIVLIADKRNHINLNALTNLGLDIKNKQQLQPQKLLGTSIKVVANDSYYQKLPTGNFIPNNNYEQMAQAPTTKTLHIVAILRTKSKNSDGILANGVAYSDQLTQQIVHSNQNSQIAQAQKNSTHNVLTGAKLSKQERVMLLTALGADNTASSIQIYPNSFQEKDHITHYLDQYNHGQNKKNKILYMDLAGNITSITGGLMNAITYVLVGFAAISLVTSMIMIAIITYTSVIERTKEIGVLKALGARKKDITRVFDAETAILGLGSGILGIIIAWILTFPANSILYNMTSLNNVAQLNPLHAIILVVISTVLTVLGGHIPARMAARKNAAIALRSE